MNTTTDAIVTYYNSNKVSYEGSTNDYSNIQESCITVTSAIEDLYEQLNNTYIDFQESDFPSTQTGIIYPTDLDIYKVIKEHHNTLNSLLQEIDTLKKERICNMNVTECSLDLGGLVDNCGNTPETFEEIINIILQNINNG